MATGSAFGIAGYDPIMSLVEGGINNYQSQQNYSASLKANYHYQKKTARNMPSYQVEGLRKAGINPIVAYPGVANGPSIATNHAGFNPSDSTGGYNHKEFTDSINAFKDKKNAQENIESSTNLNNTTSAKSTAEADKTVEETNLLPIKVANETTQAEAANTNAKANLLRAQKEAPRDPSNSGWGLGNYVTNGIGSLAAGAFGMKAVYDMAKNWFSKKPNTVGASKNQYNKFISPKNTVIKPTKNTVIKPTKNTVIKPINKSKVGSIKPRGINNVKPNSALSVKAYAPLLIGTILDEYNKRYGFGSFGQKVKTYSPKVPSFYHKKTEMRGRK